MQGGSFRPTKLKVLDQQGVRTIDQPKLQRQLRSVLRLLGLSSKCVSFLLCDNAFIRRLNKRYLRRNSSTDVIAFSLEDTWDPAYLGEVVVSVEKAVCVAGNFGNSWEQELMLYCIHGILHLLGYDDTTQSKRRIMEAKQEEIMSKLFNNFKKRAISHQPSAISSRKKRKKLKADS
ncbi:MAG: rRNA maturation RNase YbeY [Candidatus Omnitrophica bacterium]|nr:rRNA maturation RNase YbeY [Candidatus Omnitrophota bacterium]